MSRGDATPVRLNAQAQGLAPDVTSLGLERCGVVQTARQTASVSMLSKLPKWRTACCRNR